MININTNQYLPSFFLPFLPLLLFFSSLHSYQFPVNCIISVVHFYRHGAILQYNTGNAKQVAHSSHL